MTGGKALKKMELLEEYYTILHEAYINMRLMFKKRNISQDQLAEKLAVDKALISRRLRGKENLTLKTLSFMASAMDCRLDIEFIPYEEVKPPKQLPALEQLDIVFLPIELSAKSETTSKRVPWKDLEQNIKIKSLEVA